MNIKRGLFRLWVVLSTVFVLATVILSWDKVAEEFAQQNIHYGIPKNGALIVPVGCAKAKGVLGEDYSLSEGKTVKADMDNCWYELDSLRKNFPELASRPAEEVVKGLYEAGGIPLTMPNPWQTIGSLAAFSLGMPLTLLLVGAAIYWVLAGFARTPKPET